LLALIFVRARVGSGTEAGRSRQTTRQSELQAYASKFFVTQDGRVATAKVLKAPNEDLAKKAMEAVRSWKLKPARGPNGRPVTAMVTVEVWFRMMK